MNKTKIAFSLLAVLASSGAYAETRWEQSAAQKKEITRDVSWPSHEPLIFLARRGTLAEDQAEIYERQQDPDNIRHMAEAGVKFGRLHFYKGFGLVTEMDDIRKTQAAAELMHKYGMKVSLYVAGTMFTETFYREVPEALNWEQRDEDNRPVPYQETQTYRHFPSFNEPLYRAYMKKVLKVALDTIHPDQIFFDNVMSEPEPKSDRSPAAMAAFKAYLKRKYPTPQAAKDRFGYPDTDWLVLTQWNLHSHMQSVVAVDDPVLQEWIGFRCESLAKYSADLYDYIKSVNPNVSVGFNIKGLFGNNRMWANGVYHPPFAGHCDFVTFDTHDMFARLDPSGALISEIPSFKMARRLGLNCEEQIQDDVVAAVNMAFNYQRPVPGYGYQGGPAGNGGAKTFTAEAEFFRYYNDRYYTGTDNVADVALLLTWPSMAYSVGGTQGPPILMEEVLIQHKVPFDFLYEEQIDRIDRYGAVILAGQECLSQAQADRLLQYVRQGGTLVFTGNTAQFNQWRRLRRVNPLLSLMKHQAPAAAYTQAEGKGKLVYIPAFLPKGTPPERFQIPMPKSENSFASLQKVQGGHAGAQINDDSEVVAEAKPQSERFMPARWILPANHQAIFDAVSTALPNGLSVTTQAPLTTVMEVLNRSETKETMLHFVNFDRKIELKPFGVTVKSQYPGKVKSVTRFAPDSDDPRPVPFSEANGRLSFTVPQMGIYSMIVIAHE